MIMSWISTYRRNLVTIPQGVSFPRMREIVHQKHLLGFFTGFFQRPTAKAPNRFSRIFTHFVQRRGSAQGCAFSGLENEKKVNI